MKVSVIIPAFNCEKYVRSAIESILAQTHANIEILIADDGSTDATREIIDSISDPRIVFSHNESNRGYLRTVNKLLAISSGDYITFQDADDWSEPVRFQKQIDFMRERQLQVCGTGIRKISLDGKVSRASIYPIDSDAIERNVTASMSTVCYASLMFSREVFGVVGAYREFFTSGAEDVDWFYRIIENYGCGNVPEPLYHYRFTGTSITDSLNILRQIASLQFARELQRQRKTGGEDMLQLGDIEGAQHLWDQIHDKLSRRPFAEELYKFNQLLRKRAYRESFKVMGRLLRKPGPVSTKLVILGGFLAKLLLGMDTYRLLRFRLIGPGSS